MKAHIKSQETLLQDLEPRLYILNPLVRIVPWAGRASFIATAQTLVVMEQWQPWVIDQKTQALPVTVQS